ncbi:MULTISPECIES: Flp family type IVb pilin [Bradyrhizobium]|jgi:pilus assembly protein Flp/PilA|uniref:Flp family type IVb pilin n=1 Tax=Bradyrhizobium TaxID=374 RepID=UPI0003FCBE49|nr:MULTISPECIES: Flp family type IVb pilin [Bradyrhizobium]MBO4221351.1 Flp family type IVb pilin [Bradyrhizobium neotropicale]RZN18168.1 Flp family type IVb pilin [Bradyrhizobium sp. Leo121]
MRQLISSFFSDERGATAIEYCLVACSISIVIVAAVTSLGQDVRALFVRVRDNFPQ